MKNIIKLIVHECEKGIRIDTFIAKEKKDLSRTRVKNLILNENLKINNVIIKDPSKKITKGDKIIFKIPEPIKASLKPFQYKLDIIHEDEDLIIINKSAGISMHPGAGNFAVSYTHLTLPTILRV